MKLNIKFFTASAVLLSLCLFAQPVFSRALLGISYPEKSVRPDDRIAKKLEEASGNLITVHNYNNSKTLLNMLTKFSKLDATLIDRQVYDQQNGHQLVNLGELQVSGDAVNKTLVLAARSDLSEDQQYQLVQGYQELIMSSEGLDLLEQYAATTSPSTKQVTALRSPSATKPLKTNSADSPVGAKRTTASALKHSNAQKTTSTPVLERKTSVETISENPPIVADASTPASLPAAPVKKRKATLAPKQEIVTENIATSETPPNSTGEPNTPRIIESLPLAEATQPKGNRNKAKEAQKDLSAKEQTLSKPSQSAGTSRPWKAHVDLTGRLGKERSSGDVELFLPITQSLDRMLFADLRLQRADSSAKEGNFGLGYRQIMNNWIFGGYIFYDVRKSEHNNYFRQWTLGTEALSKNYDARFNLYLADEDENDIDGTIGINGLVYSGNNLLYTNSVEKSLSGLDFEFGGLLPTNTRPEIRAYLGGYFFDASNVDRIIGPKARIEIRFPDLFSWDRSLFELGTEIRDDSVRSTDYYFTARLRIPFGADTRPEPSKKNTSLTKRMSERVVRDPDIVTISRITEGIRPLTLNTIPIEFTHINDDGSGTRGTVEEPFGSLTEASGTGSDIVLLYADSIFEGEGFSMTEGQRLLGDSGGVSHLLETDQLGTIILPRASTGSLPPRIQNATRALSAANNTEIANLLIQDSGTGIYADNLSDTVEIHDITINGGNHGLLVNNSSGAINLNNVAISDANSSDLLISGGNVDVNLNNNSSLSQASNGQLLNISNGHNGTLNLDSSSSMTAIAGTNGNALVMDNADGIYNLLGDFDYAGSGDAITVQNGSEGILNLYDATLVTDGNGIVTHDSGMEVLFAGSSSLMTTGGSALNFTDDTGLFTLASTAAISATGGDGLQFSNADGSYTLEGQVLLNGGNAGIDILADSDGHFTFHDTTILDPSDTALLVDSSSAMVEFLAPSSITQNNNAPTITFQNDATNVDFAYGSRITAGDGEGIQFFDTAGQKNFAGAITLSGGDASIGLNGQANGSNITFDNAVTINNTIGDGINIQNNDGQISFSAAAPLSINTTNGTGISADGNSTGSLQILGSQNTVNATGGAAIDMRNTTVTGGITLASATSDGAANEGILLDGVTGDAISIGTATITNAGTDGITVRNSAATVDINNLSINTTGGHGVLLNNNTGTFNSASAAVANTTNNGVTIQNNDAAVEMGNVTVSSTNRNGLVLAANTPNGSYSADSVSIDNSALAGMVVDANAGDVEIADLAIQDTGNQGLLISQTTGDVTLGTSTVYNSATGFATVEIGDTNAAIDLGTVDIQTDSAEATGLMSYNTATLAVTGGAIAASDATALDLTNTVIAGGVTLASVSSANADAEGILLNNVTGGPLTIGTATITNAGTDGITVRNSAATVDINNLSINNTGGHGIVLNNSALLNISSGSIDNTAGSGLDAINSSFNIDNVTFGATGIAGSGVSVLANSTTSTFFNITNSTVSNTAGSGLTVEAFNGATLSSATVTGTDFSNIGELGIYARGHDGASIDNLLISNLTINGTGVINDFESAGIKIMSGNATPNEAGSVSASIDNVTIANSDGDTNIWLESQGLGSASFSVTNSFLNASASTFDNIYLATFEQDGTAAPTMTASITGNNLSNGSFSGLFAENDSALGTLEMYIADNSAGSAPLYGFGLFNYSTGNMTLFSTVPETDPETILINEGNSGGTSLLVSFGSIGNAPLP